MAAELLTEIFGYGLCAFSWLICAPIMTYFFIQLYRQKNEIMIYKRYPMTTFCAYIVVMIDLLIQKPFFLMYQIETLGYYDSSVFLFVSFTVYPIVYYGFTYTILWKFYLLFYEINYSKESMNDGWKNIINPDAGDTKSFFLSHHETYGNFHWISKRFILCTVVCMCISYTLWLIGLLQICWTCDRNNDAAFSLVRVAMTVDLVLILVPLVLLCYMYFTIPAFYDYFSVRTEMKLTFIILIVYYLAVFITLLEIVWLRFTAYGSISSRWYNIVHAAVTIVCEVAVILIQTKWTLKKLEPFKHIKWGKTKSKINMTDMVVKASVHDDEMQDAETTANTKANADAGDEMKASESVRSKASSVDYQLTIHDVLSKNAGFDAFMLHIVKEFSVEILVSYVEFTQLLQYLFDNYDEMISKEVHDTDIDNTLIDFPPTVPDSYIIKTATNGEGVRKRRKSSRTFKDNKEEKKEQRERQASKAPIKDKNEVKLLVLFIGSSLYNKYVKKNSDLEVNISSGLRKRFVQMFTTHNNSDQDLELELDDVIQLFVDANKEMYRYLGYSYSRFKMKRDFERLIEHSFSTAKSPSIPPDIEEEVP